MTFRIALPIWVYQRWHCPCIIIKMRNKESLYMIQTSGIWHYYKCLHHCFDPERMFVPYFWPPGKLRASSIMLEKRNIGSKEQSLLFKSYTNPSCKIVWKNCVLADFLFSAGGHCRRVKQMLNHSTVFHFGYF